MIFTVTALADCLSTAAFKIERSGVEKDQLHFGEQIPSALKERLLDKVFVAANCTAGLVKLFDCVSQKRHRPVKMMKLHPFASGDQIILSPTL